MNKISGFRLLLLAAGICGLLVYYAAVDGSSDQASVNEASAPKLTANTGFFAGLAAQGVLANPFSVADAIKPDLAALRAERDRRMRAGKYETPQKYNAMDLRTLNALADKGDVLAMLQLGEQYASEANALEYDPAFDPKQIPRKISDYHFKNAIHGGHVHIAAVLVQKNLERGDLVDAFAWNLLSLHYLDPDRKALYDPATAFAGLNAADRQAATKRYETLASNMGLR
jgi:hypothetical protein